MNTCQKEIYYFPINLFSNKCFDGSSVYSILENYKPKSMRHWDALSKFSDFKGENLSFIFDNK